MPPLPFLVIIGRWKDFSLFFFFFFFRKVEMAQQNCVEKFSVLGVNTRIYLTPKLALKLKNFEFLKLFFGMF